jgi:hypothetical protein
LTGATTVGVGDAEGVVVVEVVVEVLRVVKLELDAGALDAD